MKLKTRKIILLLFIANCSLQIAVSQPTQEWVRRFNSSNSNTYGEDIKADANGNIYVLCAAQNPGNNGDFGVIKYNSNGDLLWQRFYNSPSNHTEGPNAFDVAPNGDVYITGYSGINFDYDMVTVKYNSDGIFQWDKFFIDAGGFDLKIDSQGCIIIIGVFASNNFVRALTVKYNSNGDTLWTRKFDALPQQSENNHLALDNFDNIYTVADYGNTSADYLITKFNPNGSLIWYTLYNSPQNYSDIPQKIVLDSIGNLYVVGSNNVPFSSSNNTLLKLNNNGTIIWSSIFAGIIPGNGRCQTPKGITCSPSGSEIYYTTYCANGTGGGGTDIVTLKYNSSGDTQWVRRYWGGVNAEVNLPNDIELDKFGNIYVTGKAVNPVSGNDYICIKYNTNGAQQWAVTYNGITSNSDDGIAGMYIDTNINVYVSGTSHNGTYNEVATIKYSQPLGISNYNGQIPVNSVLYQNYPNPFNPLTKIQFQVYQNSNVKLAIYDIAGKEVMVLNNGIKKAGIYEINFNGENFPSGVYFYKMITSNYSETKKMILIK